MNICHRIGNELEKMTTWCETLNKILANNQWWVFKGAVLLNVRVGDALSETCVTSLFGIFRQ